jgi:hypothetical protein
MKKILNFHQGKADKEKQAASARLSLQNEIRNLKPLYAQISLYLADGQDAEMKDRRSEQNRGAAWRMRIQKTILRSKPHIIDGNP